MTAPNSEREICGLPRFARNDMMFGDFLRGLRDLRGGKSSCQFAVLGSQFFLRPSATSAVAHQ